MKVVVVASYAFSLVNFRGDLLSAMVEAGHEVIACAPEDDADVHSALARMGVDYRRMPMRRASISLFADMRTLAALLRLFRAERPDIILAYTQKPIIYAGIASRLLPCGRFFAMVSGLGYVFTTDEHGGRRPLRMIVSHLYRAAVRRAAAIFVFNGDDREEMMRHGIIRQRHRVVQVPGSGVDLDRFPHVQVPKGAPTFLMIARLLRDKGPHIFVEAARQVRTRCPDARFQLLGPLDPNPSAITLAELDGWVRDGIIEYLGETRDVRPHLAAASLFVLPTCYREGLPRTILEAMATGRAIITTLSPGCRETVEPGGNGFLVPMRDADALAGAMLRFVEDPVLASRMGQRSRAMAEARFGVDRVNAMLLSTMRLSESRASRQVAGACSAGGG